MIARVARLALLVLAAFALLLTDAPQAAACSGGAGPEYIPIRELLRDADTIVVGKTVEVDDSHANGIFRVQSYLKGDGAEHILLALKSRWSIESGREWRYFSGGCGFGNTPPEIGKTSILLLKRRDDGAYEPAQAGAGFYTFASESEALQIPYYWPPLRDNIFSRSFTLQQLKDYIKVVIGERPTLPDSNRPYPLTAPLMVTTVNGTNYLLRIDGSAPTVILDDELATYTQPPGCNESPCVIYAPNGLDIVYLTPDLPDINMPAPDNAKIRLQGDGALFSPTSDAFALWFEDRIEVYTLWYPRLGFGEIEYYWTPLMTNQVQLHLTNRYGFEATFRHEAVWAGDGRKLAYTDMNGLWLWDVFDVGSSPRLLVPITNDFPTQPFGRYFSPMGRYLAVEHGSERYTLDTVNGERWPDGLVSPNDRVLLAFDTTADRFTPGIHYLTRPGRTSEVYLVFVSIMTQVMWLDELSFMHSSCYPSGYDSTDAEGSPNVYIPGGCAVNTTLIAYPTVGRGSTRGHRFDFDLRSGNLATIVTDTGITVNRIQRDLYPYLDSPIVDIQWLPPLFYYEE